MKKYTHSLFNSSLICRRYFLHPQDVQLPDNLVKDFFLFDDGCDEKIIIFGIQLAIATLKKINVVYVDGTFRCCPLLFYQLFTLHADISLKSEPETVSFVPLFFTLLPNKSQSTWNEWLALI